MEQKREWRRIIEDATCEILIDNKFCSMGFVVGQGYLFSVGHPFENLDSKETIIAQFIDESKYEGKLLVREYDRENGIDYAILKLLDESVPITPIPISLNNNCLGDFISFGTGETLGSPSFVEGRIVGPCYIENKKKYLYKLSSKQAKQKGFSGSPIFSITNNAVIAIQCEATMNDMGAERDTVLAFPLARIANTPIMKEIIFYKTPMKISSFVEEFFLPMVGRSLLGLGHSDNLDAYMRCIVVKLLPEQDTRFTVFVANRSRNSIVPIVRKHKKTRKMDYGVVGGMLKENVPIIYDFHNYKCYQLGLGVSMESNALNKTTKGAKENRIALLVAPIRNEDNEIKGVLSFDFFPVGDSKNNIIEIIKNKTELDRILWLAELYAQTLSKILLYDMKNDVDFMRVRPKDMS